MDYDPNLDPPTVTFSRAGGLLECVDLDVVDDEENEEKERLQVTALPNGNQVAVSGDNPVDVLICDEDRKSFSVVRGGVWVVIATCYVRPVTFLTTGTSSAP